MKPIDERCCWKKCSQEPVVIFKGAGLCQKHWQLACDKSEERGCLIQEYLIGKLKQSIGWAKK